MGLHRRTPIVLVVPAALVASVACDDPAEMSGADFCSEVGYAIANRTLACTEDADLANARYERFEEALVCVENNALAGGKTGSICPVSSLQCDEVLTHGEDMDWWIAASECTAWFNRSDGSQIPSLLADGGVPPTCNAPLTLCRDACVDLDSDSANCGACDARCPSGTTCVARTCE